MAKHLRYSMLSAWDCGEDSHPQIVMRRLGIKYTHATPQSVAEQWWFWNCTNILSPLPVYLSELLVDPADASGISPEKADQIIKLSN